jgi:hypothetical protein
MSVQTAMRQAGIDRGRKAGRMMATLLGQDVLLVEIAGMAGSFCLGTERGLRALQDRDQIGTYDTLYTFVPMGNFPPTIEKIEYRFGRKCWTFENGAIIYDDREHSGQFVAAEGVITYIPDDTQIKSSFGRVARVRTFAEAVRVVGVFASSDTASYEEYLVLINGGFLRVG